MDTQLPRLRFACDTGGTFTDLVIDGMPDGLTLFKSSTTPSNPVDGLLNTLGEAASALGVSRRTLLSRGDSFIHGTTRATNAIVTGSTAKTALLVTGGFRDVLMFREGGGRARTLDFRLEYPRPYVPRALTFGIPERVRYNGTVVRPLDEDAVGAALDGLRGEGVEAIAVCLLWSVVNPKHELRIGQLIEERLPGVPYTLSHSLNPTIREYRRASSTCIDASLKPLMARYLGELSGRLQEEGFAGRLLLLTTAGGMVDAPTMAQAPILSIGSGPATAPVAGRLVASADAGSDLAIVTDAGGTTYDVSLIRDGAFPWTRETTVGTPPGFITGFPSVDVTSIGAGGGSIARVDSGGLLHVGPESAGADPGPVCYGQGGTRPTVTDACVVLGYVDPDYFLNGKMRLDAELARRAVAEHVAVPLGIDLHDAAAAVLQLACEHMVTAIEQISLARGVDPRRAVMIGGGGGAGLYSAIIGRRIGSQQVLIPGVAATLSAAGAAVSELRRDFVSVHMTRSNDFDFDGVNATLRELQDRCAAFITDSGVASADATTRLTAEGRYPGQVWEIEVPLEVTEFSSPADVAGLREAFHAVHEQLFTFRDAGSEIELLSWTASVSCTVTQDTSLSVGSTRDQLMPAEERRAYFPGEGAVQTRVVAAEQLVAGERLSGPLIVEVPATTVIVPPGASMVLLESGTLSIDPGARRTAAGDDQAAEAIEAGVGD